MSQKLGRLEQVDLRNIWTSESRDFTPWLSLEENLSVLGECLSMELELEAVEKGVGPFSADLLCKNTADDTRVVIENQLEKTDHKHLGQLLTYASGLNAVTVVWIASEFSDEHRAALDWLNEMTSESIRFFGLQVEIWKIGDSLAAPRFNIICQPNEWQNNMREVANVAEKSRPSEILRLKYWTAFKEYLKKNGSKLRSQKPSTNHWYTFGVGSSDAHLAALLIAKEGRIAVEICMNSENSKAIFAYLYQMKDEVESKIGAELEWMELPEKKTSRIIINKNVPINNEGNWEEQFVWLHNYLEKFDSTFRVMLRERKMELS